MLYALALLVDESVDPGVCECQRMRPGGIMWPDPAVVVPLVYDDDDDGDLVGDEDPIPAAFANEALIVAIEDVEVPDEAAGSADHDPSATAGGVILVVSFP
jgi:hypothetical protein